MLSRILRVAVVALAVPAVGAFTAELPPRNPFLAASSYPIGHGTSAQQDSVPQKGPNGPSRALRPDEIQYRHVGPGHFGAETSGLYPDGHRVFWGNGIDRIVKLDYDSFDVLDEVFFPGAERYTPGQADASIAGFDASNHGWRAIYRSYAEMAKFKNLANIYTLLDRDPVYYVGSKSGRITAYTDKNPADSRSPIVKKAEFQLPKDLTGPVMGLNLTFDGWLIVVTEHGYVAAIKRDFSEFRKIRLTHSTGAETKATGPTGRGWIRNGFAVDREGGIYIASQEHMHKVVWTGARLSTDAADGAWTARYSNRGGEGTGATPSLMGFGGEDRFVVITDGDTLMNLVLFWRDGIPADWKQLPGAPDRRIAGMQPVTMGDPDLQAIQSEQSVVVLGYGALVVDNIPRNLPWYLPRRASSLLISLLGSNPRYQPFGVQKFVWNPQDRRLEEAWVNRKISSPSCVPIVSAGSNRVYLIGARDNRWVLEGIDWATGRAVFHDRIGGQRYNPLFSGTLLDEDGRIHYGTPWGRVRLAPKLR